MGGVDESEERGMGEVKCNKQPKHVPAEFAPYESSRNPKSWVTTSVALNVFLFAVIYHEWSSGHRVSKVAISSNIDVAFNAAAAVRPSITAAAATPKPSSDPCSGHGLYESDYETGLGQCRCHACFTGKDCSTTDTGCVIDLYQGDPTMFEKYWLRNGDTCTTVILGWQRMSYYANSKQFFFVQTELDQAIRALHKVVGNAVTDGRHIVIGVGSTQLFQAALYALSPPSRSTPTSVVSLAPYYSSYGAITDYLKSGLYRWAGDAATFENSVVGDSYIELVTTPNNPTGEVRYPVVNGSGALVYDLAYYWPHFTPITAAADFDLMLFTVSKSTGHAGTRIGWAIVKDFSVAKKMAKFIELNTIGVSKDAQIRATHILRSVAEGRNKAAGGSRSNVLPERTSTGEVEEHLGSRALFHFGSSELAYRWIRLRSALKGGVRFSLPDFQPAYCTFFGTSSSPTPAFAWLRCKHEDDCEQFLKGHGILTRSGVSFGAPAWFVRLSMLDRRSSFEILVHRLETLELAAI